MNSIYDVKQLLVGMKFGAAPIYSVLPSVPLKKEQTENIQSQPDYKDEYEGFGSLTEMIKNKDKIATNHLNKIKESEDERKKKEAIVQAKKKMTELLSKKKPEI